MKAVFLLAALALASCGGAGSSFNSVPGDGSGAVRDTQELLGGAPSARFNIALYDAPLTSLPGAKVNIGLDGIQLLSPLGTVPFVTNKTPDVVNLLDLQDGAKNFKGTAPLGRYTGVRFLIDAASSKVTAGNMTFPIVWGSPGNPTTARVVAVDVACAFLVTGAGNSEHGSVTVDFNVMQSVRFVNGTIYVQPSLTAANAAAQVKGTVKNAAGKPVSTATVLALDMLGHAVNSTATKSDGTYTIHALPPGFYTIAVKNTFVTAGGETITAVNADPGAAPSVSVVLSPEDSLNLNTLVD
jgi:carboxypeptidase family protein/uncharacterized protein DUF4382